MAEPTKQEVEAANWRAEYAAEERKLYDQAVEECGPGANRYACWVIRDKTKRIPEQKIFCCQRKGIGSWLPHHNVANERLTERDHPGFEINGEKLFPFRFEVGLRTISIYTPQTAEQLAEAREKRVAKKRERLRQSILKNQKESLFPEMYEPDLQQLEMTSG